MFPELVPIPDTAGVGIYVHFPFCSAKCGYCDFFSETHVSMEFMEKILLQTFLQAEYLLAVAGNPRIATVYFGGGTPNLVPIRLLDSFLRRFRTLMPVLPDEWTIEVNPEALTAEQLNLFQLYGVSRLSMGIQSFEDRFLRLLGRNATSRSVLKALECIHVMWEGRLNLDLITGIPTMTAGDAEEDIRKVIGLRPDHVSLYSLTIEDGTPFRKQVDDGTIFELPEDVRENIWIDGIRELERAGYSQYEISNFAAPGNESLHNLRYWTMLPYAGAGPSAVSTLPSKTGPCRIENPGDSIRFTKGYDVFWHADPTILSRSDFYFEHLMMGLRLKNGVDVVRLRTVFGLSPIEAMPETIRRWCESGRLELDEMTMRLSADGRYLLNRFLIEALDELTKYGWIAGEINWP